MHWLRRHLTATSSLQREVGIKEVLTSGEGKRCHLFIRDLMIPASIWAVTTLVYATCHSLVFSREAYSAWQDVAQNRLPTIIQAVMLAWIMREPSTHQPESCSPHFLACDSAVDLCTLIVGDVAAVEWDCLSLILAWVSQNLCTMSQSILDFGGFSNIILLTIMWRWHWQCTLVLRPSKPLWMHAKLLHSWQAPTMDCMH